MMVLRRVQRWECDAGDVAYTLGVAQECAVLYSGVISHPNERHPMTLTIIQAEVTYINAFGQATTVGRLHEDMASFTDYLNESFSTDQLVSIEFIKSI
jgi:hypothetical protein